jgi:hypothetical protein
MSATYKEKLLDRRWQIKKNKIMERDGYKCQNPKCKSGENATLEVHHLTYFWHDPWDITDDLLITLCSDCHKLESERDRLEKLLSNSFKMKGFLVGDLVALSCLIETDPIFTERLLKIIRRFENGNI